MDRAPFSLFCGLFESGFALCGFEISWGAAHLRYDYQALALLTKVKILMMGACSVTD